MIRKLFRKKTYQFGGYGELDGKSQKILMSASGTVGGNVCDVLLSYTESSEQRNYLMLEAGFFGVAVASYFYTIRYMKALDIDDFAKIAFEDYKNHMVTSCGEIPEEQRKMVDSIFTREGPPAIESYIKALKKYQDSPEKGLQALADKLLDRIGSLGGINLSEHAETVVQSKIIETVRALMQSFRHFFG